MNNTSSLEVGMTDAELPDGDDVDQLEVLFQRELPLLK
jgi:hypothetical protein